MGVQSPSTLATHTNGPRKAVQKNNCVGMGIRTDPFEKKTLLNFRTDFPKITKEILFFILDTS